MLYKAKVAVSSEIRIKHRKRSAKSVEYLNFKPGGM